MNFRKAINTKNPPLLYEVVPPNKKVSNNQINLFVDKILNFSQASKIDAFFIPELVPESKRSAFVLKEKIEPQLFAKKIQEKSKKPIEIIISRVVVHLPVDKQKKWLLDTYKNYDIKNIVLVGGEKEAYHYPGSSVSQTAKLIREINNVDYYCGGITIPTRRLSKSLGVKSITPRAAGKAFGDARPGCDLDEPERMIKKQKAGIKFFISQIIFESEKTIELLKDYSQACKNENIKPLRIFLSFAPVSLAKNIDFLQSLGVYIPQSTKRFLLKSKKKMGETSIKLAKKIFEQIFNFTQKNKVKVPLGVNIGYISKNNFVLSQKMVKAFNDLSGHRLRPPHPNLRSGLPEIDEFS